MLDVCGRCATVPSDCLVTREALVAACGEAVAAFTDYQLTGVSFLVLLARVGVGGAILADEMGLGKTIQCVSLLGARCRLDSCSAVSVRVQSPHHALPAACACSMLEAGCQLNVTCSQVCRVPHGFT